MAEEQQGWHPDPFGRHEARYFSAGSPTYLVRDGYVEGSDPVEQIPQQAYPQRIDAGIGPAPYVSPAVMPSPWAVPRDTTATSGRHGVPGHSGRSAVFAAIAVVLVVGVAIVAIAATRHQPRSTAGASSVKSPTAANSPAAAANSPAAAANSPAVAAGSPVIAAGSQPGGAGVLVQLPGGHFAALFPSVPSQQTVDETVGGVHASVRAAVVKSPLTEVVEEDLSSDLSASRQPEVLQAAVAVAASLSSGGEPAQQSDTTFRGTAARTATFAMPTGERVTVLAFFQGPRTVYFLLADAGAPFQALSTSLQLDPASSSQVLS